MPTLGEAIARPFSEAAERSVPVSKTGEGQSGMRTERVVIEIEHSGTEPINLDNLGLHLRTRLGLFVGLRRINESVRVVEETHFDDLADMAMERDSAIREREIWKALYQSSEAGVALLAMQLKDAERRASPLERDA
jgi:hypothetical protein